MGHHDITLTGRGKTKRDALNAALDEFFYENGHRYSVSEHLGAHRLPDEPPNHMVERKQGRDTVISSEVWTDAPKDQWLQVWEFHIDFHA